MTDLEQRISQLTDDEAVDAVSFLAGWLREQVKAKDRLAPNILETIPDEATAVDILEETFPSWVIR